MSKLCSQLQEIFLPPPAVPIFPCSFWPTPPRCSRSKKKAPEKKHGAAQAKILQAGFRTGWTDINEIRLEEFGDTTKGVLILYQQ